MKYVANKVAYRVQDMLNGLAHGDKFSFKQMEKFVMECLKEIQ